jgi:hypothetical protein
MKKIKIKNLHDGDKSSHYTERKKHTVFLGNNVTVYFSDRKKAEAFLVETNKFLNLKLFELNALYIDLFIEYRKAWFYFFNIYDRNMHVNGSNLVIREIETIEKKMTLMVARSHFGNGSSIVWQGFKIILESMDNIAGSLIELYKTKKHYAEAHQIRVIEERTGNLRKQLEMWGQTL